MLATEDFKPMKGEGRERWITADLALKFWRKYKQPIGKMLQSDLIEYCRKAHIGEKDKTRLLVYGKKLRTLPLIAVDAMQERVTSFKKDVLLQACVEDIVQLNAVGQLDTDKLTEIYRQATEPFNDKRLHSSDYFAEIDLRIDRRSFGDDRDYPLLFIDPLDSTVRAISRGHLGLIIAPWKRGKSLCLGWIAHAYTMQALNVLFITLEDPGADVEDRFDACITQLPLRYLKDLPNKTRRRFLNYKRLVQGRLKLIDAGGRRVTISDIEDMYLQERNRGFNADAIIVDYDAKIAATVSRKEKRQEFDDIYVEFMTFIRKYDLIGWTAAQTQRNTRKLRIVTGDHVAEDIGKIRNVTMALSLGQGEWGDSSIYLYIAAHRQDKGEIGWNISTNYDKMLFFDQDQTKIMQLNEAQAAEDGDGTGIDL